LVTGIVRNINLREKHVWMKTIFKYWCRGTWLQIMLEVLVPTREHTLIARLLLLLTSTPKVRNQLHSMEDGSGYWSCWRWGCPPVFRVRNYLFSRIRILPLYRKRNSLLKMNIKWSNSSSYHIHTVQKISTWSFWPGCAMRYF